MIPEGYEKLATIGILYKGQYSPTEKYKFLSAAYYNGSTFVAIKDDPVGVPSADGINWQYMAKGFLEGVLSAINAKDTSGVLGAAGETVNSQILVDAIADKVMTKLLQKNKVLQTIEHVMASKDAENVTGAAVTAELNRKLAVTNVTSSFTVDPAILGFTAYKLGNQIFLEGLITNANVAKPDVSIIANNYRPIMRQSTYLFNYGGWGLYDHQAFIPCVCGTDGSIVIGNSSAKFSYTNIKLSYFI